MNITDSSYYQDYKKFIPNVNNLNAEIAGVPNTGNELPSVIEKYERLFIIGFLGINLYNELKTALLDLPNADVKWRNLVSGVDYIKENKTYRFDGLRGENLDSLIAYYVFCKYLENDESTYSTTGINKPNASNSDSFNPTRKYLDAWNTFVNKNQNKVNYSIGTVMINDSGMVGVDYYGNNENSLVTLETFLKDNESDYEGYNFKRYNNTRNSYGI